MTKKIYPADKLLKVDLNDGWHVDEKYNPSSGAISGKYSSCYIVSNSNLNKKGFLKAFDYRDLQKHGGSGKMDRIRGIYKRELDLLKKCKKNNIDNVVSLITSDMYYFKEGDINELVDYFILEYSDKGNIQQCLDNDDLIDLSAKFQSLVDLFNGLNDLHRNGIVHLDLNSDNLVYFLSSQQTKIADFGSARQWIGDLDEDMKDDVDLIRTTRKFAPPEFLYNEVWTNDWKLYRRKVDLYLAGNVVVNYFTGMSFTALLKKELTWFDNWNNNQNDGKMSAILPNLVSSAGDVYVLIEQQITSINNKCKNPLDSADIKLIVNIIGQLCNPNPEKRGHPKELERQNNRDGLDRIRDQFISLKIKAESKIRNTYNL